LGGCNFRHSARSLAVVFLQEKTASIAPQKYPNRLLRPEHPFFPRLPGLVPRPISPVSKSRSGIAQRRDSLSRLWTNPPGVDCKTLYHDQRAQP
jgi:hypothetical protein